MQCVDERLAVASRPAFPRALVAVRAASLRGQRDRSPPQVQPDLRAVKRGLHCLEERAELLRRLKSPRSVQPGRDPHALNNLGERLYQSCSTW